MGAEEVKLQAFLTPELEEGSALDIFYWKRGPGVHRISESI
jgi:hypothetical protein